MIRALKIFTIFLFAFNNAFGQIDSIPQIRYTKESLELIDSLRAWYGKNKVIPKEIELPCLIALSHYPSLVDTRILFRYKKIRTTMSALPGRGVTGTLFNRSYIVNINSDRKNAGTINLSNLSFNARVGIIGHELAHIVQYQTCTGGELVLMGAGYMVPLVRKNIERSTDRRAIEAGLGKQLYAFTKYVLESNETGEGYLLTKKKYYLSPSEIYDLTNNGEALND